MERGGILGMEGRRTLQLYGVWGAGQEAAVTKGVTGEGHMALLCCVCGYTCVSVCVKCKV